MAALRFRGASCVWIQGYPEGRHDPLDLLQTVCPPGGTLSAAGLCSGVAQARSFGYDWLGRLRSAVNPESGTISYEYDESASTNGAGQLTSKSQLRGVTTTNPVATPVTVTTRYHYDNLGRMVSKAYTGAPNDVATPGVTYTYDAHNPAISGVASYSKGRRTRAEVAGGTVVAFDSFDAVGRVTRSRQVTGGVPYRFGDDATPGYTYLRNGALASQRNPSGRQLAWTYDDAGRPTGVSAGGTTYVSAVTYADHGAVATMRLGGQRIRETLSYNPLRLQLTGIDVVRCADNSVTCTTPEARWGAAYGYVTSATGGTGSGPNNNGNPRWQDIVVPGVGTPVRQNYSFDAWNRLQTFTEGALSETNCYDAHGNRAVVQRAGLTPMTPQVTACSKASVAAIFPGNRVAGVTYDVSGGVASDGRSNLRYNAEDLVAKSWPAVGAATETVYEYDADGRRVAMVTGGGSARTTYVNDAGGALAAEYGGTVAAEMAGTSYVHVDALGSTRLLLDGDGAVRRRVDYWPFGVEISTGETAWRTAALGYVGDGEPRVKFTGKERDAETGFDYFGARYLATAQGRFSSVDPHNILMEASSPEEFTSFISNPQNWNRYAYVTNNPLSIVDPDGRCLMCLIWAQQLAVRGSAMASQAAQVGSRVGSQAGRAVSTLWNAALGQVLSHPEAVREVGAAAAEVLTGGQLPFGFANASQFQQFGKTVSGGLREVAGEGVQAFLGGSAITGKSFHTGVAFDVGRTSDFDIAVVGGNLLAKAKELGVELRGQGMRTGPLSAKALKALGLDKLAQTLSRQAGRPVTFMIYESEEALRQRGNPYLELH